jgi:RNA polymerase sigma factor (sigma-70 family)
MVNSQMSEVLQQLRRTEFLRAAAGMSDGQLLECFVSRKEAAAIEALVGRHGPMVWGVCRRVLHHEHDAEDAFQATFLVLVRKAASIVPHEMVANWLHGVAYQTALKARALAAKKKVRERQVTVMPEPNVVEQDRWNDLQLLLDEELNRLPEKYRVVVVLCDLEGKTRKEAARQLRCPEGTIAGRLARARVMLAKRLARRGFAVSGGVLAAVLMQRAAPACVPASVLSSTIHAASLVATGQLAAGVIPVQVAALTEGVLKTMLVTKLRTTTMFVLVVVGFLTAGGGLLTYRSFAEGRAETRQEAGAEPPAQGDTKPEQPDLLQEQRARQMIEEQRLTQVVDETLRKVSSTFPNDAEGALKLLRGAMSQVLENPDIGDRVRNDLLSRLVASWQESNKQGPAAPEKKEGKSIWNLDFRFKDPRLVSVALPGKGRKTVLYIWYEVSNKTEQAHTFIPDFELVAGDKAFHDQVIPKAHEIIRNLEDPTDLLDLKNSITIGNEPIPPSKPAGKQKDGAEEVRGNGPLALGTVHGKGVFGLALWDDVDPDAKSLTLFVSGLTNAYSSDGDTVRRKVLKINFQRVDNEIRSTGPAEWVYRTLKIKEGDKKDERDEIKKLIKQVNDGIALLRQEEADLCRKRELLGMQINLVDLEIEQATADENPKLRDELRKKKAKLEEEVPPYNAEIAAHDFALLTRKQRLKALQQLFEQTLKNASPDRANEEDRRQPIARP